MFYGLAKKVGIKGAGEDDRKAKASVLTSDGHGTDVYPDGTYPFSIYHRCLNGAFSINHDTSYGDHSGIKESNSMVAIVYADPKKVGITQEDLAFLIGAGLLLNKVPATSADASKKSWADVIPIGFNNDSRQVFTGEYEAEYALQPQSIFFSISYKIEITADRDCVMCP